MYDSGAKLLVGQKFDSCVRKDPEKGGRVPSEETAHAILAVDVTHGSNHAEPGTSIFGEFWIGGLEEDLDAVKGTD